MSRTAVILSVAGVLVVAGFGFLVVYIVTWILALSD
jgi:hypothetical protein